MKANTRGHKKTAAIDIDDQLIQNIISFSYSKPNESLILESQEQNWMHVLMSRSWANLNTLKLYQCQITDSQIKAINRQKFPILRQLSLYCNRLTEKGVRQLLNEFPFLQSLDLSSNRIRRQGLRLLVEKIGSTLSQLYIGECGILGSGINQMLNKKLNLQSLGLWRNSIGSSGIKLLIKADLAELIGLTLCDCNIGDEGAKHLVKGNWRKLQKLDIDQNNISLNGYGTIQNGGWNHLNQLSAFEYNPIVALCLVLIESQEKIKIQIDEVNYEEFQTDVVTIISNRFSKFNMEESQQQEQSAGQDDDDDDDQQRQQG